MVAAWISATPASGRPWRRAARCRAESGPTCRCSPERGKSDRRDDAAAGRQYGRRPLHHAGEGQRAERVPDQEHGDQEPEVADPVHDERLLAGVGVHLVAEPEADQQVGAEPDALPADEHHREAGSQHQDQHEDDEEVQVGEVARVPGIFLHVAHAEQVDQAADPGHDEQHHRGELVHLEGEVDLERADRQPAPEVDDDRGVGRMTPQLEEHAERDGKGREQDAGTDHGDRILGLRSPDRQRPVDQESGERQGDSQPDPVRSWGAAARIKDPGASGYRH